MKTRSCSVDPETSPTVLGRWLLLSFWLTAAGLPARAAQFQDVTTTAGLTNVTGFCLGAGWGDYDNDGRIDLFITTGATSVRTNALFRNNGDGTFTRQGAEVGPVATDRLDSCACAWIDFNNDGWTGPVGPQRRLVVKSQRPSTGIAGTGPLAVAAAAVSSRSAPFTVGSPAPITMETVWWTFSWVRQPVFGVPSTLDSIGAHRRGNSRWIRALRCR